MFQQAPNVTMTSMGPLSQNQPAPPYSRPGAPNQQQHPQQQPQQQFPQVLNRNLKMLILPN